jgi:hypothetical protein
MALGMWITEGKKVLAALTYLVSLGALSRFFNGEGWPFQAIREWRRQLSEELIGAWYGGRGRPPLLYLILDGTVLPKRGRQLPKLGWHYDSRTDGLRWGQKLILLVLRVGELALPWDWRAYVNRERCLEADFQKSTEQAVELIRAFRPPRAGEVVVAVDSSLCVAAVIEATVEEGYTLVGWVRRNRRLEDGRSAREVPSGTVACLRGMDLPVKIVHLRRSGRHYTVICTDTGLSGAQIRERMRRRWWTEEVTKRLKGLGLEDCQCRGEESLERWVEWVMLIYVLLGWIRWEQKQKEQWPAWQEAGKRLAKGVLLELGERSGRWLVRMRERFRRREPWITAAIEWFQGDGMGGEVLQMLQNPR